jgi:hypothetical protein
MRRPLVPREEEGERGGTKRGKRGRPERRRGLVDLAMSL